MKFHSTKLWAAVLLIFLLGLARGEELLRIHQPISSEERGFLNEKGYTIIGKKVLSVDYKDGYIQLSGKVPLEDQAGEKCFGCEKLVLPYQSLLYPLTCEENEGMASISYGPYSFSISQINRKTLSLLKEAEEWKVHKAEQIKPSTVAKHYGCHYLVHTTRPENLIAILSSGELNPGRGKSGRLRGDLYGNDQYVFCSLVPGQLKRETLLSITGNSLPILVFSVDPTLDLHPWHANAGHPLGTFSQMKTTDGKLYYSAHHSDHLRFAKLLSHPQINKRNEVVFHRSVPLNTLVMIVVKKGTAQEIFNRLPDESYKAMIVEIEPIASEDFIFSSSVTPYSQNSHDKIRFGLGCEELDLTEFKALVKNEYPQLKELIDRGQEQEELSKKQWLKNVLLN